MGIEVRYRRLSESELESMVADPERALAELSSLPGIAPDDISAFLTDPDARQATGEEIRAAIEKAAADPTRVDLGKDWHVLHFLLTGDAALGSGHRPDDALHNIVMGGHPIAIESTYGPVRRFSRDDLRQMVDALSRLSIEELRGRFSAEAFDAAEIYPGVEAAGWSVEEIDAVLEQVPRLRQLFEDALAENEAVIVFAA